MCVCSKYVQVHPVDGEGGGAGGGGGGEEEKASSD